MYFSLSPGHQLSHQVHAHWGQDEGGDRKGCVFSSHTSEDEAQVEQSYSGVFIMIII